MWTQTALSFFLDIIDACWWYVITSKKKRNDFNFLVPGTVFTVSPVERTGLIHGLRQELFFTQARPSPRVISCSHFVIPHPRYRVIVFISHEHTQESAYSTRSNSGSVVGDRAQRCFPRVPQPYLVLVHTAQYILVAQHSTACG